MGNEWSLWHTLLSGIFGGLAVKVLDHLLARWTLATQRSVSIRDSDLTELERVVICIRQNALAYWETDNDEGTRHRREAEIAGQVRYLGRLVASLFDGFQAEKQSADLLLNKLDNAVTGGDFQVAGRKAELTRLRVIEVESYEFLFGIRMLRRSLRD